MTAIRHHFSPMKKILVCLMLLLFAVALPTAAFAQYPPTTGGLTVNKTVVEPGEAIAISGEGFCPNTQVTTVLKNQQGVTVATLGTFTTDAAGRFSGSVTIPASTAPGRYTIEATGLSADCIATRVLSANITVRAAAAAVAQGPPSSGVLSATGADVLLWLLGAAVVIAGGVGILRYTRRRSAAQ